MRKKAFKFHLAHSSLFAQSHTDFKHQLDLIDWLKVFIAKDFEAGYTCRRSSTNKAQQHHAKEY